MTILFFLGLFIYVLLCGAVVSLILMQEGKGGGLSGVMGASMGETFGFGGASKQVRRYTAICATAFLVMTIILTFLAEAAFRGTESRFIGSDTAAPVATQPAVPTGTAPADPAVAPAAAPGEQPASPGVVPPGVTVPAEEAPAAPAEGAATTPAE